MKFSLTGKGKIGKIIKNLDFSSKALIFVNLIPLFGILFLIGILHQFLFYIGVKVL